jgi:flagellar biosynthetic protein FliR
MSWLTVGGIESILWCYLCVAIRLGPMLVSLPPFASAGVSVPVRVLLIAMVSLSITPLVGLQLPIALPSSPGIGLGLLAMELIFGASIALSIHLFLAAFQTAGTVLADLSGLKLGLDQDQADYENPIQRILVLTTGVLFVLCGAHRWAIEIVLETFERFPVGSGLDPSDLVYEVSLRVGQALSVALRLALPAAIVMISIGMAQTWISRTLAAWDRLALGNSLQWCALLCGLLLSMSATGWFFQDELALWMDQQQRSVLEPIQWSTSSELLEASTDG